MLDETLQPSDESYDVSDVEAFAAAHQSPSDTMGDGDGTAAAPTLSKPGLLVMDVDSTLIDEEVIDELGEAAGSGDEIAKVTERAMRGEIEFCDALRERVALLKGLPVSVFDTVHDKLHFTNGALALIDELHRHGWKVGVVSGGFHEVVDRLAAEGHIDHWLANRLEVVEVKAQGKKAMRAADWARGARIPGHGPNWMQAGSGSTTGCPRCTCCGRTRPI